MVTFSGKEDEVIVIDGLSTTIRHHRKNLPHTEDAELMLQVGHRPVVRVWEATDAVTKVIVT